jgi:hypothetical protein
LNRAVAINSIVRVILRMFLTALRRFKTARALAIGLEWLQAYGRGLIALGTPPRFA